MDPSVDGVDMISSMPYEILHHILSFIPTQYAIRTSALSRAWKHVWCETPRLDFFNLDLYGQTTARDISQTLSSYRAPKITSLKLRLRRLVHGHEIDSWIEFVVSRHVEKLTLVFSGFIQTYSFPDFFYLSSSLRRLCIRNLCTVAGCSTVSWKSLRRLTLRSCNLCDESIGNILSGSPILKTLKLIQCIGPDRLDLSKSRSLKKLKYRGGQGTFAIVAPHIHYLSLRSCVAPCILVDVSLLAEASIHICMYYVRPLNSDFLQTVVLNMLAKLQNAKRLTFTSTVLQILSLAELHGVPLPTFKVETLNVRATFIRSVIPGLARLLQNSPKLKMLLVHATRLDSKTDRKVDSYLRSQGLNQEKCWRSENEVFPTAIEFGRMIHCKDAMWKLIASFMEMVMRNVKTLETLVVGLEYIESNFSDARWFEDFLQMIPTLHNSNNVSIVLKP